MLLTREQLQERLIALHRASLELVKDVSLDHLLNQIATLACEQAEARYAALGVLDGAGKLDTIHFCRHDERANRAHAASAGGTRIDRRFNGC